MPRKYPAMMLTIILLLLFAATPVGASNTIDIRETDVLNLRLGIPRAEVEATLMRQGIPSQRWDRHTRPCPADPATACLTELIAPTRDGKLAIGFAAATGAVRRIDYTFKANGAGEPDMIRRSVMRRFGEPSDLTETAWCPRITPKGTCPADGPSLRFWPGSWGDVDLEPERRIGGLILARAVLCMGLSCTTFW